MFPLRIYSAAEQVARHLKEELARGVWSGTMPGGAALARELGVGRMTVDAALEILETEGLLQAQGAGKRRKIVTKKSRAVTMRVGILFYEPGDATNPYIFELRHQLTASGHEPIFAPKTLTELGHNPKRVASLVNEHPAEAWIVVAGSKPVLEWFARSPIPTFALFGRMLDLPISGTGLDKSHALKKAIGILTDAGHRRIVMLVREERRKPYLGFNEKVFLQELESREIPTGNYNLPDWEESSEGLKRCLDGLFQVTPPTAMIVGDAVLLVAIQNYLSLHHAQHVALVCMDPNPAFQWCDPPICHLYWDHRAMVRRIVRWVEKVAHGKDDFQQRHTPALLYEANIRSVLPP